MGAVKLSPCTLADTIVLIQNDTISSKIAKELLPALLEGEAEADGVAALVEAKGMGQISDEGEITKVIEAVMAANPKQVEQYRCAVTLRSALSDLRFSARAMRHCACRAYRRGASQLRCMSTMQLCGQRLPLRFAARACRGGKTKLQGFFQGQAMKETGGRVNPALLARLLPALLAGDGQ
jgi:Asp-tRNA(Asn)/Glu-tRNA(Gln) amidotransferase B subunit